MTKRGCRVHERRRVLSAASLVRARAAAPPTTCTPALDLSESGLAWAWAYAGPATSTSASAAIADHAGAATLSHAIAGPADPSGSADGWAAPAARRPALAKAGGNAWESNPPRTPEAPDRRI